MTRAQRRALRTLLLALQEATDRWVLLADAAKTRIRQAEAQLRRRRRA